MSTKTSQKTKNNQNSRTAIWIAAIGLLGTIGAAIITSFYGYKIAKTQIDRPLAYTQIAEATLLSSIATNSKLITPNLTAETSLPSITPQPLWQDFVEYKVIWGGLEYCPNDCPRVIPNSQSWGRETKPTNDLGNEIKEGKPSEWGIVPLPGSNDVWVDVSIKSKVIENEWVKLSGSIHVNIISYPQEMPEYVHTIYEMSGCGGAELKHFPSVDLKDGFDQYSTNIKSKDFDFFTLEPGEYDVFVFHYACNDPGIYHVTLEQQFTFKGQIGTITWSEIPLIYCPQKFIQWEFVPISQSDFGFLPTEFFWDGSSYVMETK